MKKKKITESNDAIGLNTLSSRPTGTGRLVKNFEEMAVFSSSFGFRSRPRPPVLNFEPLGRVLGHNPGQKNHGQLFMFLRKSKVYTLQPWNRIFDQLWGQISQNFTIAQKIVVCHLKEWTLAFKTPLAVWKNISPFCSKPDFCKRCFALIFWSLFTVFFTRDVKLSGLGLNFLLILSKHYFSEPYLEFWKSAERSSRSGPNPKVYMFAPKYQELVRVISSGLLFVLIPWRIYTRTKAAQPSL
jgi:hypothetical protein